MEKVEALPRFFFEKIVLEWPKIVLLCIALLISFFLYQAKNFKLDASEETIILEDDNDLLTSRLMNSRFGTSDFILVTFAPKGQLFSDETLSNLTNLRDDLRGISGISSVISILDVPLLESPPVPVKELATNVRTLESPGTDIKMAMIEFQNSPIYRNLLVSPDLKVTALQINFPVDTVRKKLLERRNSLKSKRKLSGLSSAEDGELRDVVVRFDAHRDKMKQARHEDIIKIRSVMDKYRQDAELFLGGVSMISDDLVTFIKKDLQLFGVGVLVFLIVILKVIFKQKRWIMLPMLCCFFSAVAMMGILGLTGWEVTVISSNFISLQLIITMAITIHLIVKYLELLEENPEAEQKDIILGSVLFMLKPCLYAALTTIAGFGSLVLSNILPVINFGWMMIAGITVSLLITFLVFPSILMLLQKKQTQKGTDSFFPLTAVLAKYTVNRGTQILIISGITLVFSVSGISQLIVENSFIDYFKKSTEIYQGMKVIDQHLGGTTPLDVIIDLSGSKDDIAPVESGANTEEGGEFDEFSDFDEFESEEDQDKYWFTSEKMEKVKKIHAYLDNIPETGKVLSLGTMLQIAEKLNNGEPLDNFKLALLYSEFPDKFKDLVLNPYVSLEHNQVRFAIRIRDSDKNLQRDALLKRIKSDLINKLGFSEERIHITGMMVLYNNMLQSLFDSQIKTLGLVVLILMVMFLFLFKSVRIALIAIAPNLLSIGVVLGIMGWLRIPLDMMTITIAAISVGIAVDDTIHYIHRFKHEFPKDRNYVQTLYRCHETIGHAMYYTSVTIIIGFSILVLSNFIPSIYFGILTGLAMLIALIGALTLLPCLILVFKPFGKEPV